MIIDSLNKDTHYFTLDLHKGAILSEPLMFKQYDDKSRELAIELTVHDKPLNLTDARIDIWVDKQDGHTVTKAVDRANIDLEDSIVLIPLTRQMLILPPSVECEIVVTYADKRVLSFPIFEIQIERSNVDVNDVVSTSEFQLFYDTLYQMERWMRDYLKNYAIVSEAINNQLNLLRQKIIDIGEDWEDLQEELTEQNNTNIEDFKKENKKEFDKKYNEQLDFYNGLYTDREKEINRLLEKIQEMEKRVQEALEAMETLHTDSVKKSKEKSASLTQMETHFALKVHNHDETYAPQEYVDTYINPIRINALSFGIQEGRNVDIERNTRLFQDAIDFCKNDKVLVFPSGEFIFNSVDLGEKNNITIVGASSSFATFAQKDIETGEITDTLTKIICNAPKGETFFKHKKCVLIMENIAFYNLKKDNKGNFTATEAKENIFMQHIRAEGEGKNIEKGKAFLSNCAFYGWKVCFGSEFTFQHLEDAWGTGKQESDYEYIKQSCVMAHRCRFTRNGVAINQTVDSRIVDCSFNKNNYAIVLRENSGFTTIANCRIEWNLENGIYSEKAHDVTVANCEFDCNGYAGLYTKENTNSNFSNNIFRRSGAKIDSTEDKSHRLNYEQNSHIYANGNINCNFIGNNTAVKPILDVKSAPERPTNCSYFLNNNYCIINANNLAGCTKQELTDANKIENNTNSIFSSNIGIANN